MKNELLYSFLAVLAYFVLNFALCIFLGNENSRNAMLILNIPLMLLFCHFYFGQRRTHLPSPISTSAQASLPTQTSIPTSASTSVPISNLLTLPDQTSVQNSISIPSAANYALILLAMSIALSFLILGVFLHQGIAFLFSIYFLIPIAERIAMPFVYEKFILHK